MRQPRLKSVSPGPGSGRVTVTWTFGRIDIVDLGTTIRTHPALAPLLKARVFDKVRVSDAGRMLTWNETATVSAAAIWRLAQEKAREAMPAAEFRQWMTRHGLSLSAASAVLGMSRRMVVYYSTGQKLIPKTVRLACLGAEIELARTRRRRRTVRAVAFAHRG